MPFTVSRSNTFASQFDVSFDAALDVGDAVNALVTNEFEPVTIDRGQPAVHRDHGVPAVDDHLDGRLGERWVVRLAGLAGRPSQGDTLRVRVRMRPYRSTAVKTSLFTLTVPANTAGRAGSLTVTGGVDLGSGAYSPALR